MSAMIIEYKHHSNGAGEPRKEMDMNRTRKNEKEQVEILMLRPSPIAHRAILTSATSTRALSAGRHPTRSWLGLTLPGMKR